MNSSNWRLAKGRNEECGSVVKLIRIAGFIVMLPAPSWPEDVGAELPEGFENLHRSDTITQKVLKIRPRSYRKLCFSTYSR